MFSFSQFTDYSLITFIKICTNIVQQCCSYIYFFRLIIIGGIIHLPFNQVAMPVQIGAFVITNPIQVTIIFKLPTTSTKQTTVINYNGSALTKRCQVN